MPEAKDTDLSLKEWETARTVISRFDDLLDGLRRYGFTFITGLITAQSLLASNVILGTPSTTTTTILPSVKLAVILATLILIVGLRLLDRGYQMFQEAAVLRAQALETRLNLELTKTITDVYRYDRLWVYINLIYIVFAGAAGLLGTFLLEGDDTATHWLWVATALAIVVIPLIHVLISIEELMDCTFDKPSVTTRESITATVTIKAVTRVIPKGRLRWNLQTPEGKEPAKGDNPEAIRFGIDDPYYLTLDMAALKIERGFYTLEILNDQGKQGLFRRPTIIRKQIRILPPTTGQTATPIDTPATPKPKRTRRVPKSTTAERAAPTSPRSPGSKATPPASSNSPFGRRPSSNNSKPTKSRP